MAVSFLSDDIRRVDDVLAGWVEMEIRDAVAALGVDDDVECAILSVDGALHVEMRQGSWKARFTLAPATLAEDLGRILEQRPVARIPERSAS